MFDYLEDFGLAFSWGAGRFATLFLMNFRNFKVFGFPNCQFSVTRSLFRTVLRLSVQCMGLPASPSRFVDYFAVVIC